MAYAESDRDGQALVAAFREGLQKLGGRRAAIFGSTLAGRADVELMQRFAREIVELQLDLILSGH
jgi:putative ABC transport system substrate-binding protein